MQREQSPSPQFQHFSIKVPSNLKRRFLWKIKYQIYIIMTWILPLFGRYSKVSEDFFFSQYCTYQCWEIMQNPLTTSKHYSNKNCIILPVHVSSISSSAFLLTQWMNAVPQHFIIQFILVFRVWQTLFLFSFMSSRKRALSIWVSCPGLFHRGTVTKHGGSITVTHTRKSLGYPP